MKKRYKIIIEKYAMKDIKGIIDYLNDSEFNKGASKRFIKNLENRLLSISLFPKSSPLINNNFIKNKNIRKLCIDKYIVFYELDEIAQEINILRVISGLINYIDIL